MEGTLRPSIELSNEATCLVSETSSKETIQHPVEEKASPNPTETAEHSNGLDTGIRSVLPRESFLLITKIEQHEKKIPVLTAIDDPDRYKLPSLSYKPFTLEVWFLSCSLILSLAVLSMLIIFYFYPTFDVTSQWGYFTIKILPTVIGTITAAFLDGIALTLSRLTPFILCASSDGATAGDTILRQYFPNPDLFEILKTRNWLLLSAWSLCFAGNVILAFKASLLNTTADDEAIVTRWALIPLTVIYGLIALFVLVVMRWLREKKSTGLRWDPVSIADHLMLFRHSNVLGYFEGTDLANRRSIFKVLKRLRLRLGYWKRENGDIWHGFGLMESENSENGIIDIEEPPRKCQYFDIPIAKEIQSD